MCNQKNGPGKFEGEPCYAEELYNMYMAGETEDEYDDGSDLIFSVYIPDDEFRARHHTNATKITFFECEFGFVNFTEE